jgi:hypothetical protein
MGGLAFGSLLTMILVPVLYAIFFRAHPLGQVRDQPAVEVAA